MRLDSKIGVTTVFLLGFIFVDPAQAFDDTNIDPAFYARPALYSWMLPKTLINVSVVYTLTARSDATGIEVSPTVTLSNVSVADTDLGPEYPDGVISIRPEDLISFWQDKNISVKTNTSTGILSYLGSGSTNQSGQILGTAITSVAKLTAAAFGTPAVQVRHKSQSLESHTMQFRDHPDDPLAAPDLGFL
jgi:hypothetical protein